RASTSTVEDVRRLAGRPRAFQTYSTPIGPTLISGCPRLVPASPSRYTTTLAAPSAKGRGRLHHAQASAVLEPSRVLPQPCSARPYLGAEFAAITGPG